MRKTELFFEWLSKCVSVNYIYMKSVSAAVGQIHWLCTGSPLEEHITISTWSERESRAVCCVLHAFEELTAPPGESTWLNS